MPYQQARRTILKTLGVGAGAAVLSPMLSQLAAHAAGDSRKAERKRVIFVMQSNGMNPAHLVPLGVERSRPPTELTECSLADRELHAALTPLAPFKNRMVLVQGLSNAIAYSDHSCNQGALGCFPKNKGVMQQTIDLALAEALPGVYPHLGLGYSGGHESSVYNYSVSAPGRPAPILCSPAQAFNNLFGSVTGGSGREAFDLRTNLLDFMADDVRRSRNALVGDEKQKFDSYLSAFESLHARQQKLVAMQHKIRGAAPQLGHKLNGNLGGKLKTAGRYIDYPFYQSAGHRTLANLYCTLLHAAGRPRDTFGIPDPALKDLDQSGPLNELLA